MSLRSVFYIYKFNCRHVSNEEINYNYCVSGHCPLSCFYLKHVLGTGFCLCLQVDPAQLVPINIASPCLWR
jgi:hypothetical protein